MPELWLPQGGVNRKQKELWLPDDGVNRKQKELWAVSSGANRKIFTAGAPISTKAVGSIVKINVGGTPRNFIVLHHGLPSALYDASCNGTWIVMEDIYNKQKWSSFGDNYSESLVAPWLYQVFYGQLLDANIRAIVKNVKVPYYSKADSKIMSGAQGLSCYAFLLAASEMFSYTSGGTVPDDGVKLTYFVAHSTVAYLSGAATQHWTRSGYVNKTNSLVYYAGTSDRNFAYANCGITYGVRPAMVLPFTALVDENGTVLA